MTTTSEQWKGAARKLFAAPLEAAVMAAAGSASVVEAHGQADGRNAVVVLTGEKLIVAVRKGLTSRSIETQTINRSAVESVVAGPRRMTGQAVTIQTAGGRVVIERIPEDQARALVDALAA
jgi:hypothetical protein